MQHFWTKAVDSDPLPLVRIECMGYEHQAQHRHLFTVGKRAAVDFTDTKDTAERPRIYFTWPYCLDDASIPYELVESILLERHHQSMQISNLKRLYNTRRLVFIDVSSGVDVLPPWFNTWLRKWAKAGRALESIELVQLGDGDLLAHYHQLVLDGVVDAVLRQ
jgi:hypothetical protein